MRHVFCSSSTTQAVKELTCHDGAGRVDRVRADGPGGHDGGGAALARVDAGDGPAPVPAAEGSALEGAADVGVGVLDAGLPVVADRRVRGGLYIESEPRHKRNGMNAPRREIRRKEERQVT